MKKNKREAESKHEVCTRLGLHRLRLHTPLLHTEALLHNAFVMLLGCCTRAVN